MKAPKELTRQTAFEVFQAASQATGTDFPRGFRIAQEVRGLSCFMDDKKRGIVGLLPPKEGECENVFLHLKPADLPKVWDWIKAASMTPRNPITPKRMIELKPVADELGQAEDYEKVLADLTKETEDKE